MSRWESGTEERHFDSNFDAPYFATHSKLFILALAVLGIALSAVSAKADNFSFSITNTIGTVSGTFTGQILGLTDNSTGPASQVIITSFPAGLNSIVGNGPIDATLWDQQYENSFTESGGQVIAGGFWAQQTVNSNAQGLQLYVDGGDGPYNFLNLDGVDALFVWGDNGLAAANIQPLGSTPEPGSVLLLGTGFVALLGAARRKLNR